MVEIGCALDPGIRRRTRENQDAIAVHKAEPHDWRPSMIVVADGMGGYEGGAVASSQVIKSLSDVYLRMTPETSYLVALEQGVVESHAAMQRLAEQEPRLMQMGSTVVAAMLKDDKISLVNVGDSRAYLINPDGVRQISYDHSFVGEAVRSGLISQTESRTYPRRNVLTMSISVQREQVEIFSRAFDWQRGDRLLICSDGLWGTVAEEQIQQVVLDLPPQEAADRLVHLANANQGPDNIAVVVAHFVA